MSSKMHLSKKESVKKPVTQPVQAKAVQAKAAQPVIVAERVQGNYDIALVLSKVKRFI
jgi:hypothetical protein